MENRLNYLHCMYISIALGLIAKAKERKRLVEYKLYKSTKSEYSDRH